MPTAPTEPDQTGNDQRFRRWVQNNPNGPYRMRFTRMVEALFQYGWLPQFSTATRALRADDETILAALLAYQGFHGLDVDGIAGPQTERSLQELRFCKHPDVLPMQADTVLNRWPDPNVRYWIDPATLQGMPVNAATVTAAVDWGWNEWRKVCGIKPERTDNQSKAHVAIQFGNIDGSGKVLAYSELADGTMRPRGQRYDSQERWVFAERPERYSIDLGRVACHEIGHVLGIPHIANGNLLQPMYDVNIRSPQAGDVAEATARYGPPSTPTPPPTPTQRFTITIEGTGSLTALAATGFQITKVA